jgi:hypothetical protein
MASLARRSGAENLLINSARRIRIRRLRIARASDSDYRKGEHVHSQRACQRVQPEVEVQSVRVYGGHAVRCRRRWSAVPSECLKLVDSECESWHKIKGW